MFFFGTQYLQYKVALIFMLKMTVNMITCVNQNKQTFAMK